MQQGVGLIPSDIPVQPHISPQYVEPSYVLARPPSDQSYSVKEILSAIEEQPEEVIVLVKIKDGTEGFCRCCKP